MCKDIIEILKDNYFFKKIKPKEFIFNTAFSESICKIKELSLKLAWYYDENKLKMDLGLTKLFFWLKIANNSWKHFFNRNNFFPILTKLVIELFETFHVEIIKNEGNNEKEKEEYCINYIKKSLKEYFNIGENREIKDYNSIKLKKVNNLFELKEINQNKNSFTENIENIDNEDFNSIDEKNILAKSIDNINKNIYEDNSFSNSMNETNLLNDSNSNKNEDILKTFKKQFEYNFNFLAELFYNSNDNFNANNYFENHLSIINNKKNEGNLINLDNDKTKKKGIIFDITSIKYSEILKYVRSKIFNSGENINLTNNQKMKIKLFFILYLSYKIISENYENIKKKGYESKTISEFYYRMSDSYNKAIDGFNEMKKDFQN